MEKGKQSGLIFKLLPEIFLEEPQVIWPPGADPNTVTLASVARILTT
jgi:hypothetical protein